MALMSQRQYAAHRGVARYSVQRAIAEGRISTTPDGRIDPDLADAEWERNTIAPEGDGSRLLKARTVYMVSKARLADMQLKKLTGELLPAAEVKVAAFNAARRIRDACMRHSHALLRRGRGRDPARGAGDRYGRGDGG